MNSGERQVSAKPQEIDKWHRWRYDEAAKLVIPGNVVIDFGCGIGYGSRTLAEKAARVYGLDDSVEALHFAATNYHKENIEYHEYDLDNDTFCFEKESVDLSVAFEVLEHLEKPGEFLQKVAEVTRGMFILSVPHVSVDLEKSDFHYKHYTEFELSEMLKASGFKIVKMETMMFSKGAAVFCVCEK